MVSTDSTYNMLPAISRSAQDDPIQEQASSSSNPYPPNNNYSYPSPQMSSPHVSPYGPPVGQPYPTPPQAEPGQEGHGSNPYPQMNYDIQLRYPQEPIRPYPPPSQQGLPLPPMAPFPMSSQLGYGPPPPLPQEMEMDTTGQVAPPGSKPRVTATLWEDEGTLCFQVDVKGTCVARREDNHMINGTKLLNVAGMTRGRRDGILKSEKTKHVVKIGPMHLKGVWIPYDRALNFANKERITAMLYPLFVHNIGSLLYHPVNRPYPSPALSQIPRQDPSNPISPTNQNQSPYSQQIQDPNQGQLSRPQSQQQNSPYSPRGLENIPQRQSYPSLLPDQIPRGQQQGYDIPRTTQGQEPFYAPMPPNSGPQGYRGDYKTESGDRGGYRPQENVRQEGNGIGGVYS